MRAPWTPSTSRRIPAASFPLPPRLEGLRRLAYNLHWAWHPRTRNLWSLIDRTAWTRYRNPIPVISGPTDWSRLLDDAKFLAEYHDVLAEFDRYMANGSGHWFQRQHGDELDGPIAYFCAEYGLHESLGHLLGRPRRPRRRPHEVGQRHGPAVRRRRAALPQGLLPPVDRRRRPPGARLPRLRPDAPAARAGPGRERPAADRHASSCRGATCPSRSGWPRSAACRSCCSTRTSPRTPSRTGPITHILYVRGREMRLHQELVLGIGGVRAHPGARPGAGGLAPQRGPLGVPARRAGPRVRRGRGRRSTTPGPRVRRDSVFTIHTPVSAGNERFDADLVRRVAGPLLDARRRAGRRRPRARARHGRRPRPVRHDRLLPAPDQRRERRQPAPRRDRERDLAGRHRPRDPRRSPTASTRPTWVGSPVERAARAAPRRRPRRARRGHAGRTASGSGSTASRATDLWEAHLRQKRELAIFARGRLRSQFARHGEAPSILAEARRRRSTRRS